MSGTRGRQADPQRRRERLALATLVCEARLEAGLSRRQLADRIGRSVSYVARCEDARRRIDLTELADIAHATGVPLATIVARLERRLAERRSG